LSFGRASPKAKYQGWYLAAEEPTDEQLPRRRKKAVYRPLTLVKDKTAAHEID
jgi:hypothetical protein